MKLCSINGCKTKAHSRTLCTVHYARASRSGTLPPKISMEQHFWSQVNTEGEHWLWNSSTNHGYGNFCWDNKVHKAHRISFTIANGEIPDGLEVDHICRVRGCVRPDHLRAVTRKQNQENHGGARVDSKSGIRGVTWHKRNKTWIATFQHDKNFQHLGTFTTKEAAAAAVLAARLAHFTHNELDKAVR